MFNFVSASLLMFSLHFQDPSGFWIPSASSADNAYYFKSKYLNKVGSNLTIWTKVVPTFPEESDGKMVYYKLSLLECNCSNYSTNLLALINYGENGETIDRFNYKEKNFNYEAPGSVGYREAFEICKYFSKKKK